MSVLFVLSSGSFCARGSLSDLQEKLRSLCCLSSHRHRQRRQAQRTWILSKDPNRVHDMITRWSPMSISYGPGKAFDFVESRVVDDALCLHASCALQSISASTAPTKGDPLQAVGCMASDSRRPSLLLGCLGSSTQP